MMIKVCGMRDAQNIREVDALGVDMIGFIFWPGSKRYCAEKPAYLPKANRVGVFVNAAISEIVEKVREYELYIVQLHGDEDLAYVSKLHKELDAANVKRPIVIRAIQVSSRSQVIKANMWDVLSMASSSRHRPTVMVVVESRSTGVFCQAIVARHHSSSLVASVLSRSKL